MPEIEIVIGGRSFEVACAEGEEHYLQSAAELLNREAQVLTEQIGRLPESRMLLMAGLMLADKSAGIDDRLADLEAQVSAREAELEHLRNAPAPEPARIEVPVVPDGLNDTLAELAVRAEALADSLEETST